MKLFTVEEANALLPTVREVVGRIQRAYTRVAGWQESARQAAECAQFGGGGMEGGSRYMASLTALAESAAQLEALGVQLKDYGRGRRADYCASTWKPARSSSSWPSSS